MKFNNIQIGLEYLKQIIINVLIQEITDNRLCKKIIF